MVGVDYAVFDCGVNRDVGRSGKVLRSVLGLAADDWRSGACGAGLMSPIGT